MVCELINQRDETKTKQKFKKRREIVSKIFKVLGVMAIIPLLCLAVVGCGPTPPPTTLTVSISSPAADATIATSPVTVTGTVSNASATVTVNSVTATVATNGAFSAEVPLQGGVNTITVTATLAGQSPVTESISVTYSGISVHIDSPTEGDVLHTSPVTVSGTVSDPTSATIVTVNGVTAQITLATGAFFAEVPLTSGENTITATATATPGGVAVTDSVKVTYSLMQLTITSPANNAIVHTNTITVTGTVSPANVMVSVNDVSATVETDGTFHAEVTLTEGENTITATASLMGGEPVTQVITVTYTLS